MGNQKRLSGHRASDPYARTFEPTIPARLVGPRLASLKDSARELVVPRHGRLKKKGGGSFRPEIRGLDYKQGAARPVRSRPLLPLRADQVDLHAIVDVKQIRERSERGSSRAVRLAPIACHYLQPPSPPIYAGKPSGSAGPRDLASTPRIAEPSSDAARSASLRRDPRALFGDHEKSGEVGDANRKRNPH